MAQIYTDSGEIAAKLVLLGDSGANWIQSVIAYISAVGKTSVVLRYVQGTFLSDSNSTVGASFITKKLCAATLI